MSNRYLGTIGGILLTLLLGQTLGRSQTNVLPRPFEVYGGTIGVIDAIPAPGETNKTRVFASTDSANSVFYGDVDHASAAPLGTNFTFQVVPDLDANANFGAPRWLAAHQPSGRIFMGGSSGLVSCTITAGSLVTEIADPISFVLIQGSSLFAVNDMGAPETPKKLYYGTLSSSGTLTLGADLGVGFTGSVFLAISPRNNKLYALCAGQTNFALLKSSDDYDAFSAATTFSAVPTAGVTLSPVGQVTIGPDGRLFLGGGSTDLEMAYSDDAGASWTNFNTGAGRSGGGIGLNIVCNGDSNAYEVYYGWVVSSNKGLSGTWAQLPRGGYRPPAMHVNAGSVKVDPLDSNTIYVTTDKGIGGSLNAGVDVVELNKGLLAFQINDIDALADKSVAWIASKAGIRIATNFSTTPVWTDGEFPDAIVNACAIDATDPSGMTGYAGSCRLYKTTTGGGSNASSWVQVFRWEDYIFSDGHISAVKANGDDVALGYYSYAQNSPSGGVWYSSNGGSNWSAIITNTDIHDLLVRDEGGTGTIYAAVSRGKTGDRGGIYRIAAGTPALDMTNEVNIRKLAEDSSGGIYASGTIPDAADPARYQAAVFYRADSTSGWSQLTINGLPSGLMESEVIGRAGSPPVITVGKDSATNDVPVLACLRTIYYLPYGGSSWMTVTNYPNGTQIKTLFYDELMVGTTIGLYSQGLNAAPAAAPATILAADFDGDGKADPALYVKATGTWYVKLSGSGYGLVTLSFGSTAFDPVARDFDGDGKADPAIYHAASGLWKVKLSANAYAEATLNNFGGASYEAVAGDYDGDGKADPAIYEEASGKWQVAMSSAGYAVQGVSGFGGAGRTAVQQNYDSDHRFDAAIYNTTNGNWTVLLSAQNYITANLLGFGGTGYDPILGDFDGDGLADPAIFEEASGKWQVKLSGSGYGTASLEGFGGSGYLAAAADYDGDGKADLTLLNLATGAWRIKLSGSAYAEATLASGWTP